MKMASTETAVVPSAADAEGAGTERSLSDSTVQARIAANKSAFAQNQAIAPETTAANALQRKNEVLYHEVDVARHAGEETPSDPIPKPILGSGFELDPNVVTALPIPGTKVLLARNYGMSLWGQTARIDTELPSGEKKTYFLKTISLDDTGRLMMRGEYESLLALHSVSADIAPKPFAWGKYANNPVSATDSSYETHFLLTEFREVGEQPPNPYRFTECLAQLHKRSVSPTGKFGFHVTTCHAKLPQITDCWEESWAVLYRKQLGRMVELDRQKSGVWPEFEAICDIVLDKVIPRLLEPLQSEGRTIKPCLVHGDLWDENTATDMDTGEPFIFDSGAFYAHNEYEIGNWRAVRHRLSGREYIRGYMKNFPASRPEDEWDDRNLLYSVRYDLGAAILIPGSNLRRVVKDNMELLCRKFFPDELRKAQGQDLVADRNNDDDDDQEEEEEEEEEP